jgi:HEAT repeat protein
MEGLTQNPDNSELWKLRLEIHLAQYRVNEAVSAYQERIMRHGPDNDLFHHLALSLLGWGLRHRDANVRLAALQEIRKADVSPLESDMLDRLKDPQEVVRSWAALALSQRPEGAEVLEQQLHSSNPQARTVAAKALGQIAGPSAITTLALLVNDSAAEVRSAAAHALGNTKKHESLPALLRLSEDNDKGVRADAIAALGVLGDLEATNVVRKALNDPYAGIKLAAIASLANLEGEKAKTSLSPIAAGEDITAALRASLIMAKWGEIQPVLSAIAKGLVDRLWTVRAAACNTASSVKDPVTLRLIRKAQDDPSPSVRAAASRALYSHGDKENARRIALNLSEKTCTAKGDDNVSLCLQASELLAQMDQPIGLLNLKKLSRTTPLFSRRIEALQLALKYGAPAELALESLTDSDARITMVAAGWIYSRTEGK